MIWGYFGAVSVFAMSLLCFGAAWLIVRFRTENAAWASLWSAGLWATALSPIIGLIIVRAIPETVSDWSEATTFHGMLTGIAAVTSVPTRAANEVWSVDLAVLGWFGAMVYATGLGVALIRLALGRHRVRCLAHEARPDLTVHATHVYVSDAADMPFVWTPFGRPNRSRIVLPRNYLRAFSTTDLRRIVAHEQAHIRRRDDEHGLLLRIMLAGLWFSPFSHSAFARWAHACELQCDARILQGLSKTERAQYAQTLIGALQLSANRVRQFPAATFSNDRLRNEKMRITHIMSGNGPVIKRMRTQGAMIGVAALFALAGGAGLASVAHADSKGTSFEDRATMTLENIVTGRLTAPFGKTFDPFRDGSKRVHQGIDIAGPIGTAITAPADGTIVEATDLYDGQAAYGKVVVLQTANETLTLFSHLDSYQVRVGQRVQKGDKLAEMGNSGRSTGPHVHIETMVAGERVDPLMVWSAQP